MKQTIFIIIYTLIFGGIGFGVYESVRTKPTCDDGIKNQSEDGVDCGTVCGKLCPPEIKVLQLKDTYLFNVRQDEYDIMAKVHNPNDIYGSKNVNYRFILKDSSGGEVDRIEGKFFILPNQTRYIVKTAIRTEENVDSVELEIDKPIWEMIDITSADASFALKSKNYINDGQKAVLEGVLSNSSEFDFDTIEVSVILQDLVSGEPKAVNSTVINTLPSGQERYFKVDWPFKLDIQNPDVLVSGATNVFLNSNFVKRYGSPEKFKEFIPRR